MTDETNADTDIEPFAQNQIAATLAVRPDDDLLDRLRTMAGDGGVRVLAGAAAVDELTADGVLDKLRHAVSEDARAIDQLTESLENGEAVVIVDHVTEDEQASRLTNLLVEHDAGWVYRFDELTWTELHSPAARRAREDDV